MHMAKLPLSGKFSPKIIIAIIVVSLFFVAVIPGYYFYMQYQKTQKMLQNPTEAAKEEIKDIVAKVGNLILLPADEEPTLATVSDKTKLGSQAFFARAENGDKVLIYPRAKKAFLYRPSSNKIIDVAPVNIGAETVQKPVTIQASTTPAVTTPSPSQNPKTTPSKAVSPTPTKTQSSLKPVNVTLYNGTKTVGLAASVQTKLKTIASFVTVVSKGNATDEYTETLVIDFSGKFSKEASELAKLLKGSVGVLPKSETKPTGDILVILGPQQ